MNNYIILREKKVNRHYYGILFKLLLIINIIFYNSNLFYRILQKSNNIIKTFLKNSDTYNISMKEAALKADKFIRKTCKDILIYKIPKKLDKKSSISVIIPLHNREKTIKRAVRSIQNQNIKYVEIILVNDGSKDNSIKIIKDLSKEDFRIKIIDNKKHRGTLYCRTIGTLMSKGKFIFPLDSDDMYLTKDILKDVYKDANENNIDIINFKGIYIFNFKNSTINNHITEFRTHKKTLIEKQPHLGYNAIGKLSLAGKCIKSKIYKKAIKAYGQKRYSIFITNLEDAIMNYIIYQFSENAKSILRYGVLIIRSKKSDSVSYREPQKNKFKLYYIETLFEFSRNSTKGKFRPFLYFNSFLINGYLNVTLNNKKNKKFLKSLINKVLSSEYISEINKEKIKNKTILLNLY